MSKWFPWFTTAGTSSTGAATTTLNIPGIIGFLIAVGIAVFVLRKLPVADKLVKGA